MGTTNVTCADYRRGSTFKALDEQNCNVGKTETEHLGEYGLFFHLQNAKLT